jgi:metal-responsive CopG/Arc/MetJ family transcriptional regulator
MGTTKVTFTLDETTVKRIETASQRLALPKSQVVREAVNDYYERMGKMSEPERKRMLRIFDEVIPRIPSRPLNEVRRELKEIRLARQLGGRAKIVDRGK